MNNSNKPRLRGNNSRSNQDSQASTVLEIPLSIKWARIRFKAFDDVFNGKTKKSKVKASLKKIKETLTGFQDFIGRFALWHNSLKAVEQTYGKSYMEFFKFMRWLFGFNALLCLLTILFIIAPQSAYQSSTFVPNAIETNLLTQCSSIINNTLSTNDEYVKTECCKRDYISYLNKTNEAKSKETVLFDLLQGTGVVENTFLFYGFYSTRIMTNDGGTTYYMGYAFLSICLINLIFSALSMIFRLGEGLKNSIVKQKESMKITEKIFCFWDFHLSNTTYSKSKQVNLYRSVQSDLRDLKESALQHALTLQQRLTLIAKRVVIFLIVLGLFCASGYGIYELNKYTVQATTTQGSYYVLLLIQFLPAIAISALNTIFPLICFYFGNYEAYSVQTTQTLYIARTGFIRLGSILFLLISITVNIFNNTGICSAQTNSLLIIVKNQTIFSTTPHVTIKCWETYVGQQFYKLAVFDLLIKAATTFLVEYPIGKMAQRYDKCVQLQYEFNLALKFLDILYIQTIFWLALFFSPFLCIFAPFYYFLDYYLLLFELKHCCKLSKNEQPDSNIAFFLILFLVFLFVLIVNGLVFSVLTPSRSCGPFQLHNDYNITDFNIYDKLKLDIEQNTAPFVNYTFGVISSSLFLLIVAIVILVLIWITYSYSSANADMANSFRKIIYDVILHIIRMVLNLFAYFGKSIMYLHLKERGKNSTLTKQVARLEDSLRSLQHAAH